MFGPCLDSWKLCDEHCCGGEGCGWAVSGVLCPFPATGGHLESQRLVQLEIHSRESEHHSSKGQIDPTLFGVAKQHLVIAKW